MICRYEISDLREHIARSYLFHAWGLDRAGREERNSLLADGEALLNRWSGTYSTHAIIERREAYAEGDDIIVCARNDKSTLLRVAGATGVRFPMLRQQTEPFISLSDFVRTRDKGGDEIGLFATSTDSTMPELTSDDPYERMLAQTLADRLAEAAAEMVSREMPGIRPAAGYPSMPDTSINFLIDEVINLSRIGIRLTESGMMVPHASVSGLIFTHPKAQYFSLGRIGEDQLADYSRRRGFTLEEMRRFIRI